MSCVGFKRGRVEVYTTESGQLWLPCFEGASVTSPNRNADTVAVPVGEAPAFLRVCTCVRNGSDYPRLTMRVPG